MLRVRAYLGERHLVRAPAVLHRLAVHLARAGPALGRAQDDHRPARPLGHAALARGLLDLGDLVQRLVEHGRKALVNGRVLLAVEAARHDQGPVAVALEELEQLLVADPRQHGRVGDLVAVQVQDGEDGAVLLRVEELVRVPAGGQRTGLGLAVADDAAHEQIGVVEGGAEGVGDRVAELAALVDRAGNFGRHVARDAAREGELAEEGAHAVFVTRDVRVELPSRCPRDRCWRRCLGRRGRGR